jgi:predicted SAM-dependent methyltransferase
MSDNSKELKLHLGCWTRHIPGWINIDQTKLPNVDCVTKVHDLHMFEDNSCDVIYASHVLEYYDWQEAEAWVLPEWYRVLKPNGLLRISVPDISTISRLYQAGMKIDWFIGPMYGRMLAGDTYIYHKCIYDDHKLKELLEKCGFVNFRRYDWKKTDHAHVDDHSKGYIPHMRDDGILLSLNVEVNKEAWK